MPIPNVFNRRKISGFSLRRYASILYRGLQFVESAEWNEQQDIFAERLASDGDAALGPISLRNGGTIVVDKTAGTVRLGEADIWAGGYMHKVPSALLLGVPMVGTVAIGIAVTRTEITENEDPDLRGIVPSESQGEALGARLRFDAVWATSGNPFYPVYTLIDGQLPTERVTPQDQSAELAVERHIRQTHGAHVIDGFRVSPAGFIAGTGEQEFVIAAGTLRAEGREVRRTVDQRYRREENPELVQVNGETALYPASGNVVTLNNGPIESVQTVTVIKEKTVTITHQLANGADPLPNTPVYSIQSVSQGGTTYVAGTSYAKVGDTISWAAAGAEPSPGSSYNVTFRYVDTVTPITVGRQTLTLEAAVPGQPVTMNYRYKLPRIDTIAIDLDGLVNYIEGVPSKYSPVPPLVPLPLAPLARIDNRWGIDPIVTDVNQRKLTEAEVQAAVRQMLAMDDRLSLVELTKDIQERDPASRKGSFVDPFENDLQRDFGIAQDAAIVGGILQLPIVVSPMTVEGLGPDPIMLPYVTEAVVSQPFRTTTQKINRYLAFAPLPASLSLQPAIDRWNENQSSSSSSSTSSFVSVSSYRPDLLGTSLYGTTSFASSSSSSTSASSVTTDLPFLRSIAVNFRVERMGPGENLQSVLFDGINVTPSVTGTKVANGQGVMTGAFTIPPNIQAGTKQVVITGQGGTRGTTSFTGQGTLTVTHYHTSTHTATVATTIDPVAQSFSLDEPRQITGARVEFTARGNPANPVIIEMRADANGLPAIDTLAEGVIPGTFNISSPTQVLPANWTEGKFRFPTVVPADSFRWIALLTNDEDHSIALAQLGDQSDPNNPVGFDARRQQWIRRNPASGDFADGSNGVSWLLQPNKDLTTEIMAARYTSLTRTVQIGGDYNLATINPAGISDIIVLMVIEQPSPLTTVKLELVRASGEIIAFEPGVALSLDTYLTEIGKIRAVLTGTETLSPIIMPDVQILWGRMKETATYVSEAIALDQTNGNVKVRSVVEANTPGTSSLAVAVGAVGSWIDQTAPKAVSLGDGWIEREYLQTPVSTLETREKITLTGTPKDRPRGRKLRVRATGV